MKIAVSGLGRMGMQIARKLQEDGHIVVAHDITPAAVDEMKTRGAIAAYTKAEVVAAFGGEPVAIWLMVPSEVVDAELTTWLELVPAQTIFIDGGNSDFRHSQAHAEIIRSHGSSLIDVGTSGGVWGYKNGFSMMVGGDDASFVRIKPILDSLSSPEGAYHHFGGSGAGHYVKMVHNAIEYGMMESLAEGYRLLKEGSYPEIDLAAAGEIWQNHSVITSWLNQLTRDALIANPRLDGINGDVAESGEARWALEIARQHAIETPAIQAAFDVRLASQTGQVNFATKLLAAMRNQFGGHNLNN